LFSNDNKGFFALEEAILSYQTPGQQQFLFAHIILEGYPAWPLWDHFHKYLTLDYDTAMSSKERGTYRALQQIADFLQDGSHSLKDYGLPEPTFRSVEVLLELEAFEGRHEQLQAKSNDMLSAMNAQDGETPSPFFIEGKPG